MEEIKDKINNLLREILGNSKDIKSQIKLLRDKEKIIKKIDEIICLYERLKNEK